MTSTRAQSILDHQSDSGSATLEELTVQEPEPVLPRWRGAMVIMVVSLMTLMSTVLSGILAVALPKIAEDIGIEDGLLLWPASVYSLSCACTLLFFGNLADVVGARNNYMAGSLLSAGWILASGLARTGIQLIIFRALHGIAISMCLPSSVSILTSNFKPGQWRNTAFASLGAAQPTGFLIGLFMGGVLTDLVSWRLCFYLVAGINAAVLLLSVYCIPADRLGRGTAMERFRSKVDWVGVVVISAALSLLSYVLAAVTVDMSAISEPANIGLLTVSALLFPTFALWVQRQEKLGRPALIPNSLWSNAIFRSISLLSFLAWATVTANQYFIALYFEKVQLLSAFSTSLRFLPLVASGVLANVATGILVRRVRADILIAGAVLLSSVTPLLMALADPALPYWSMAFPAALLSPIAADVVLTIANLAITSIFPPEKHGLAGGVTNTLAQLGTSFGLNLTTILASAVTIHSSHPGKSTPQALDTGYRASFWASFAATIVMLALVFPGLGKIGKVGAIKYD